MLPSPTGRGFVVLFLLDSSIPSEALSSLGFCG